MAWRGWLSLPLALVVLGEVVDELLEGQQLLLVHERELRDEVVEMFEARVKVRLLPQRDNLVEVRVVDVRIHLWCVKVHCV